MRAEDKIQKSDWKKSTKTGNTFLKTFQVEVSLVWCGCESLPQLFVKRRQKHLSVWKEVVHKQQVESKTGDSHIDHHSLAA